MPFESVTELRVTLDSWITVPSNRPIVGRGRIEEWDVRLSLHSHTKRVTDLNLHTTGFETYRFVTCILCSIRRHEM